MESAEDEARRAERGMGWSLLPLTLTFAKRMR